VKSVDASATSEPRVWWRAGRTVLGWTAIASVSALVWYQANGVGILDAYLNPVVSAGLDVTVADAPSPFIPALQVIGAEVGILVILAGARHFARRPRPRSVPWTVLLGPAVVWLSVVAQYLSGLVGGPLASPGLMFVSSAAELCAVGAVVLAPALVQTGLSRVGQVTEIT
jgi:hypothetical protein